MVQRVLLAVLLGYFLSAEIAGLVGVSLTRFLDLSESATLSAMFAFIIYTLVILWAFADRSLIRLWVCIPGGAISCYSLSTYLAAGVSI
ncbi:MAG: hypothetical protein COA96_08695 [SAR86 cluster bacterium]|uniref:Iron transporter n=1 Tax=SAR86 cluster bacterium TaxID=2030880 RepID=A0A2A5AZP0_9GAMM|nr:MAG: hypothetical protein COA96_08695 [SAR86 cluster bacterium]